MRQLARIKEIPVDTPPPTALAEIASLSSSPVSGVPGLVLEHEPFLPEAEDWSFPSSGPLSGANGAIPWIVFARDRAKFELEFPGLVIEQIRPFLPFRYLVSGGVGMRNLMPGFLHGLWAGLEQLLGRQMNTLAMFAFIALRKE